MNTLKPLVIIAVLAAVGIGLYRNINSGPISDLPDEFNAMWGDATKVTMPGQGATTPGAAVPGGAATPGAATPSAAFPPTDMSSTSNPLGSPVPWKPPPSATTDPSGGGIAPPPGITSSTGPPNLAPGTPAATTPPAVPFTLGQDRAAGQSGPTAMNPTAISPSAVADIAPFGTPGMTDASQEAMPGGPSALGTSTGATAPISSVFATMRAAVQTSLDRGELSESLLLLSRWHGDPSLLPTEKAELDDTLGRLAGTVIYSPEHFIEAAYVVQPGDTLESIGKKFQVSWQLLAKINGITQRGALRAVRELKVVRGPFSAIVSLNDRELTLMLGGRYAGRFSIGIGQDYPQMEGRWVVQQKQINPTYYGRDRTIDADDPENPLGEHMVGLAKEYGGSPTDVFGIHGTNDPSSIARDDPRGFIRLAPADAGDVFDILSVGSRVFIRR